MYQKYYILDFSISRMTSDGNNIKNTKSANSSIQPLLLQGRNILTAVSAFNDAFGLLMVLLFEASVASVITAAYTVTSAMTVSSSAAMVAFYCATFVLLSALHAERICR